MLKLFLLNSLDVKVLDLRLDACYYSETSEKSMLRTGQLKVYSPLGIDAQLKIKPGSLDQDWHFDGIPFI